MIYISKTNLGETFYISMNFRKQLSQIPKLSQTNCFVEYIVVAIFFEAMLSISF